MNIQSAPGKPFQDCPAKAPPVMKAGTATLLLAMLILVLASFWTLNLKWGEFLSLEAFASMGRFLGEFFPMDTQAAFLKRVGWGTVETLAMSLLGTALAAAAGLALAIPASKLHSSDKGLLRTPHPLDIECAAIHPGTGVGRAVADFCRAWSLCRHAGAGLSYHGGVGSPVCRIDRECTT